MKLILGDNQYFGINHLDLKKGEKDKLKFPDSSSIIDFIGKSIDLGIDGFMMNSNLIGYDVVEKYSPENCEIHFSIPYPHKYASMVNENGLLSLMLYFLKKTSYLDLIKYLPNFIFSRNLKFLLPLANSLEIPKNLKKGSVVYLQNIVTDLVIGLNRTDILEFFAIDLRKRGYRIGIQTVNPVLLFDIISKSNILNSEDLILCFNINYSGFKVWPNLDQVEKVIHKKKKFKLMGMSIFSSGGGEIKRSINYIKKIKLDYAVFGSSNLKNIQNNINSFKSDL